MWYVRGGNRFAGSGGRVRRTGSIAVVAVLAGLSTLSVAQRRPDSARPPVAPGFQEARDILQKTINVYQSMASYEGQSNVDSMLLNKNGDVIKEVGSTAKIRYRRPNKLMLDFSTPGGSRSVWSDGSMFIVYDALPKRYTVTQTAPNLAAMLPLLFRRADVSASLDPLYCLSQKSLPKALTNVVLKENAIFNGHPVYVVSGTLAGVDLTNAKGQSINLQPSTWTWWIDRNTFLIHKVEARTPNVTKPITTKLGNKETVTNVTATLLMRHTVTSSKPNSAIPDAAFVFKAPADASERKLP